MSISFHIFVTWSKSPLKNRDRLVQLNMLMLIILPLVLSLHVEFFTAHNRIRRVSILCTHNLPGLPLGYHVHLGFPLQKAISWPISMLA